MTKLFLVTEWVLNPIEKPTPSFVVGVYSTLQGAQDSLKAQLAELVESNPDREFSTVADAEDICVADNQGVLYHYNIIQRTLDE